MVERGYLGMKMAPYFVLLCAGIASGVCLYVWSGTPTQKSPPQSMAEQSGAASRAANPEVTDPELVEFGKRQTESFRLARAGQISLSKSEFDAAESDFRQALILYSHNPWALIGSGMILERQGRPAEALAAYRQALGDRPDNGFYSNAPWEGEAMARYGLLAEGAGQWAEAVTAYEKARERLNVHFYPVPDVHFDPAVRQPSQLRAMLYVVQGLCLDAQSKQVEALGAFAEAAHLDPEQPFAQFNLARGLRKAGRAAEARAAFQKAARLGSGAVQAEAQKALR